MAVMDGYQSTVMIRTWEREHEATVQSICILGLSADSTKECQQKAKLAGMDYFEVSMKCKMLAERSYCFVVVSGFRSL